MFKLIFFLVGLAVAIIFSALNIGNVSDISLGFKVFSDVPVFFTMTISFLAGTIFTLPFAFFVSFGKRKTRKKQDAAAFAADQNPDEFIPKDIE